MAKGGARPGAGAKKNQHRIAAGELRRELEQQLGMSYTQMLAQTQVKLFNDFRNDVNIKEYLTFTENMCKRIVEHQIAEVSFVNPIEELSKEDIEARIKELVARETTTVTPEDDTDAQDSNGDNDIGLNQPLPDIEG